MLLHWSPDPVAFQIANLKIHWYGLCWLLTFWSGEWLVRGLLNRAQQPQVDVSRLMLFGLIGTILGARLVHCLVYEPAYYLAHPVKILAVWEGGLASHGGAIGLILGLWLGLRQPAASGTGSVLALPLLTLLDATAVPAALGGALIRLANFINSEIVGKPTDGTFGVIFDRIDALPRHPVQLYEAVAYVLIGTVLAVLAWRRPQRLGSGMFVGLFLALVFAARLWLEQWKMPQAAYEAGQALSVGQWLSVPFIVLGLVMVWRARSAPGGSGRTA